MRKVKLLAVFVQLLQCFPGCEGLSREINADVINGAAYTLLSVTYAGNRTRLNITIADRRRWPIYGPLCGERKIWL